MTIQPGSLDYLYYNGILDHIPYEAYSMPTLGQGVCNSPAYDPRYLDNAKMGYAYQYDGIDAFTPTNPVYINNYKKSSLQEFKECFGEEKNKFKALPTAVKGLLASGVIATTLAVIIKRIKHK